MSSTELLTEQQICMKEFIEQYKSTTVLWDSNHPDYSNKKEREKGIETIICKCKHIYPEADVDFVRAKINSLRSSFRRENRKVSESKAKSKNAKDVYKPNLWYYDLLLFLTGEESNLDEYKTVINDNQKLPCWNRRITTTLIDLLKKYPSLYDSSHIDFRNSTKKKQTMKQLTERLNKTTKKNFKATDVQKKIELLKREIATQYRRIELAKKGNYEYFPSLWCFEMIKFLKPSEKESQLDDKVSSDELENSNESFIDCSSMVKTEVVMADHEDDIYDTIGKNVAHKLRDMAEEQKKIAGKIINELMYQGQMENLTSTSKLVL